MWNPTQYERFKDQRSAPFYDLLSLLKKNPRMTAVDLGCGTGELTRVLHQTLEASATLGIDNSDEMLEKAPVVSGLQFKKADLADIETLGGKYDLIFSNAAIQWVDDHPTLLRKLKSRLNPAGQLAVQVPANHDHPSHLISARVAQEPEFSKPLNAYVRTPSVLSPEDYSLLLEELGFSNQSVRLQIYLHRLNSRADVIEWVKGTLLTDYQKRMTPELFSKFLTRYREVLFSELPDLKPYPYVFKRILFWAEL